MSLYIYEHPHHHCPFCILKSGHGYAGYVLYIPLFMATALGLGAGVIAPWKKFPSLAEAATRDAPRLTWLAVTLFALFYLAATWTVVGSSLTMRDVWW